MTPKLKILASEWFEKGNNDLKSAQILFAEKGPNDTICYHSHQTVEKYLKGFLVFNNVDITSRKWKIHILPKLLKKAVQFAPKLKSLVSQCSWLDSFYIDSKYPVNPPKDYSRTVARKTIEAAEKVVNLITELMG